MTALIDTLFQLEKYLGLELDSLLPLAESDDIGGFHPDASQAKWGAGAIWDVEGRTLYALIRALKPEAVLEIGGGTGCSTNHIASALKANGSGHLVTLDRGNTPQVFAELKSLVDVRNDDAINYLALLPDNSIDFLLEDADHSEALCAAIGELAKTKLRPGGVLMAHDAVHFDVGKDVRAGYDLAGLDFRTYLTDPSDCGWAVWRRPDKADLIWERTEAIAAQSPVAVNKADTAKQVMDEMNASLADTESVLQAQEDENRLPIYARNIHTGKMDHIADTSGNAVQEDKAAPEIIEGIKILTEVLYDGESTEEKITQLLKPTPAKRKVVRKAKPKAKK